MKFISTNKFGYRQIGFGYFDSEPDDRTFHIDLWWWSLRWDIN